MKRVVLWTTPRSLSTAFYRCITTLKNTRTKCLFELFCMPHYFGPPAVRRSSRYEVLTDLAIGDMVCEPTYQAVKELLKGDFPGIDLVFAKEFAFCIPEAMFEEIANLPDVQHTFLIRDPKKAITSHFKTSSSLTYKDEFITSEAGYKELCELYRLVKKKSSTLPVVIDAYDLQAEPEKTMMQYCSGIGIQFESHMTSWEPNSPIPGVGKCWEEWVSAVTRSSGIIQKDYSKQRATCLDELPKKVIDCIDECDSYYSEMFVERMCV